MKRHILQIGFLIIIVLMIVASLLSIMRLDDADKRIERIVNQRTTKLSLIMDMYTAARERSVSMLKMLSMQDPFEREEEFENFNAMATRFAVARLALVELVDDPEEVALVDRHLEIVRIAVPLQLKVIDLLFIDDFESAKEVLIHQAIPTQNEVLNHLLRLIDYQESAASRALDESHLITRDTSRFLITITLLAVMLSALIAVFVTRALRRDERQLRDYAETLEQKVQDRTRKLSTAYENLEQSQSQLIQSEKLASLGQLTAGIAHEIKNPLNFINNFSETAREGAEELAGLFERAEEENGRAFDKTYAGQILEELKSDLDKISRHGERANKIIHSMLLHAHQSQGTKASVEINQLLDESLNLAFHSERARNKDFTLDIEKSLSAENPVVMADATEISRALLNFFSNAFYAMEKRKSDDDNAGYRPQIEVKTVVSDNNVFITIGDNGCGIPAEQMEKIFNPFFTTKPPGEGTGLGLSTSFEVIEKRHDGKLSVQSQVGQGTLITISLPVSG